MTQNEELNYQFLHAFSRFEFALKTTGFLVKGTSDAKPDWDTFARLIETEHKLSEIKSEKFKESVKYFFDAPPRKQIINGNTIDWEEHRRGESDFNELLILVRRVRNNFFHGGKFAMGPVTGSERNTDLLKHALVILYECLELNQDVKSRFFEE